MNTQTIAFAIVVFAIIWTNLRFSGRIMMLEYRLLLATEALAEMEGSKESKLVAKQARDEITKRYWFLDKIVQS